MIFETEYCPLINICYICCDKTILGVVYGCFGNFRSYSVFKLRLEWSSLSFYLFCLLNGTGIKANPHYFSKTFEHLICQLVTNALQLLLMTSHICILKNLLEGNIIHSAEPILHKHVK